MMDGLRGASEGHSPEQEQIKRVDESSHRTTRCFQALPSAGCEKELSMNCSSDKATHHRKMQFLILELLWTQPVKDVLL